MGSTRCWAYIRRKFFDAQKQNKTLAQHALSQISLLYDIEAKIKEQTLSSQEILEERERLAAPIIDALETWIEENYKKVLPKSTLGKAMSYTYSLIPKLRVYLQNPALLIDNNMVENAIRPLTLGRKNFLFCGNHNSAKNTAIMFTLINSCKHNDVNIREWLTHVMTKIPYMTQSKEDLHSLLPANWK